MSKDGLHSILGVYGLMQPVTVVTSLAPTNDMKPIEF